MKKNQSDRLTEQHKESKGVIGIFVDEAQQHDEAVSSNSHIVMQTLKPEFPFL